MAKTTREEVQKMYEQLQTDTLNQVIQQYKEKINIQRNTAIQEGDKEVVSIVDKEMESFKKSLATEHDQALIKYNQEASTRRLEVEKSYKTQIDQMVAHFEKEKIGLEQKKQEIITTELKKSMVEYDQKMPVNRLEAERSYKEQITKQVLEQVEKQKQEEIITTELKKAMVKYDQDTPVNRIKAEESYKKQITEQIVPQVEQQRIELEQHKQKSMTDMTNQIKLAMEKYDVDALKQKDLVIMEYDQHAKLQFEEQTVLIRKDISGSLHDVVVKNLDHIVELLGNAVKKGVSQAEILEVQEITVGEMHPHPKLEKNTMSVTMDKMDIHIVGLNVHEKNVTVDVHYNDNKISYEVHMAGLDDGYVDII